MQSDKLRCVYSSRASLPAHRLLFAGADTEWDGVRWSHLCQAVDKFLPAAAEKGLGKPFYLLFWRLTYGDISWPASA